MLFCNDELPPLERAKAMTSLYPDSINELPPCMPHPLEKGINIKCFVYADHNGNKIIWYPHTGIMIFVNMAPITWL